MPPLIPSDVGEVQQWVVVTTGPEWRPVVEPTSEMELVSIRELPEEARRIEFLSARLSDRLAHFLAFKTLRSPVGAGLRIEPFEQAGNFRKRPGVLESQTTFTPDPPSEPESTAVKSVPPGSLELPVALEIKLRVSDLSNGFDHYRARFRLAAVEELPTFRWTLAEPAELIGVTVEGHRVVPLTRDGSYAIEYFPIRAESRQPGHVLVVELEYRVPAAMRAGPNFRNLMLPVPSGPVLRFDLDLVVPDDVRLTGGSIRVTGHRGFNCWN